ncbi:FMN-dependent oxidoreductase (nitrilotriacetate monooxygenase family) [Bradyrhizobium macuxiense]|uniref:FMN-dependent oxidoreductase (Nitrilotriacetate monooxygenase family) n=1 Tax=Bradyrhizobium macuxiense TaxID=1755647 RepID=A0A560KX27_9BRAD|nr:NtaA/DmoA family FMN-dependent monooxygenase [Bradyrhizobium macuxiense]TWB87796.1 FMN-dependent oxidoreductase (nitrilotriacetate monooxygenase family) [Bradyrhizobium macuxiense]
MSAPQVANKPRMHLALDISWQAVDTDWRSATSWVNRSYPDIGLFEDIARTAERGCFDLLFCGDSTGIPNTWEGSIDAAVRTGVAWPRMDMSPWIARMAAVTSHIGFGLTYSSTFMHPFYVARLLNSLDHVTNGRIAFNVVTSQRKSDAENYGFDELMEHDLRYDRMDEFMDVCRALWGSVAPDAFLWDKKTGIVADTTKVHPINHAGKFFKVKGPLSVMASPQITPVLIQAGGSARGLQSAARFVDHVFAFSGSVPQMVQARSKLDSALKGAGRDPAKIGVFWGARPLVAETEAEAIRLKERLIADVPMEAVGVFLSHNTGLDMSKLPQHFTLRELNERIKAANASPVGYIHKLAQQYGEDKEISRSEFLEQGLHLATGYADTRPGTASQIADYLEEAFVATGERGGFMLFQSQSADRALLQGLTGLLIPELQRRGRVRTCYEGRTLRENLAQ